MILSYQSIKKRCLSSYTENDSQNTSLISPFNERQLSNGMSYGLSHCGYDVRVAEDIKLYPISFKNLLLKALGFKRPSFVLCSTIEYFSVSNDLMATVLDKSSWARQAIAVQNTCLEPSWKGYLTLELTYHGDKALIIPAGAPIAQIVFHMLDMPTDNPYNGKYNNQRRGPQPAIYQHTI